MKISVWASVLAVVLCAVITCFGWWPKVIEGLSIGWLSNLLSLAAVAISLAVALVEQNRANKDARKAQEAEASKRVGIIEACIRGIDEAEKFIKETQAKLPPFRDTDAVKAEAHELNHVIEPILDYARGLQLAIPADADLALTLARTCRTYTDLYENRTLPSVITKSTYKPFLQSRLDDLIERRAQFEGLLPT